MFVISEYIVSLLFLISTSSLSSAIVKNVAVLAKRPVTLDARVGSSFNLSAFSAAKLVELDALSVKLLSTFELTNVSTVEKPSLKVMYCTYLQYDFCLTLTKCPL